MVDDLAVGRLITLARQRKQWRQDDLAAAAGVSQSLVALLEAGLLERLTIRAAHHVAAQLGIRLPFTPLWNGGEADRLRDRDHANLRAWLRRPAEPLSRVWFLSSMNQIGGIQVNVGRQRVRLPRRGSSTRIEPRTTNAVHR